MNFFASLSNSAKIECNVLGKGRVYENYSSSYLKLRLDSGIKHTIHPCIRCNLLSTFYSL